MIAQWSMMARTVSVLIMYSEELLLKKNCIVKLQQGILMTFLWVETQLFSHTGRQGQVKPTQCSAAWISLKIMV